MTTNCLLRYDDLMTVNVQNYTRVRYGVEEHVSAHNRGDARDTIKCESGPYFTERQIRIMNRR